MRKSNIIPDLLLILLFSFSSYLSTAQNTSPLLVKKVGDQVRWVDSIYNQMELEEKVGQLFMVGAFSDASESDTDKIKQLIEDQHIGGVIFSKGGPVRQARLTNEFQELSKTPLFVAMDAEWGLAMRLDSTYTLPWNMTLGAIKNENLIEEAGAATSRHLKRLGVHINFAPVVDINTNPNNPIIGNRSFGEEKKNVTSKSLAFLKGMQREGVLATAKHFPGHGDTDSDSHKTLPSISFSKSRLNQIELYPYNNLIEEGLSGVMVAHLNVPSLTEDKGIPSSLSSAVITDLLKKELNFKGLIFTDALNMKGVSTYDEPGDVDLAAFLAGNDVLLMSEDVSKASAKIIEAYNNGDLTEPRLAQSVRKILFAKYKAGLSKRKPIDTNYLYEELKTVKDDVLYEELMENAVTLIKNNGGVVPVKKLERKKIAYVNFGDADGSSFLKQMRRYADVDWVRNSNLNNLLDTLEDYNYVVIGYHKPSLNPWGGYRFTAQEKVWIQEIASKNTSILTVFTSPYALNGLSSTSDFEGILIGYQNNEVAHQKTAQVLFGAIEAKGKLPVSLGIDYPEGTGYTTKKIHRLSYGLPESVGMNSYKLKKIDSILDRMVSEKMAPGAQVIVARKGKVIFERNVGFHTYKEEIPVTDTSVYDLASLTKILATLPIVMKQVEEDIIKFDSKLEDILPSFKGSNKGDIKLQDMLMHYAKLKAWIPFYVSTLDKKTKKLSNLYYSEVPTEDFNAQVADNMYIRKDIQDTIVKIIRESNLEKKQAYKYSDLPFYLMKYYLESYYNKNLNTLTRNMFYESMGANTTGFLPRTKFNLEQIVPTEEDKLWRDQVVHGYVHDQGAAMLGGIGGHAGLFSNANDVAKIMQMYLNGGEYGGEEYFKPETIAKFNTCYYCEEDVRRGVGFDKPQLEKAGPTCNCVSMSSFGHSGFTGTFVWADPEEEIIYVFLSNRTFPDPNNRKLIRENVRSKIQEVIYESIDY